MYKVTFVFDSSTKESNSDIFESELVKKARMVWSEDEGYIFVHKNNYGWTGQALPEEINEMLDTISK